MRADEEERAALFRQQEQARCKAAQARERALRGNSVARKTLQANWEPVLLARIEARAASGQEETCE